MVSGGGAAAAVSYRRPCRAGPRPEAAARSGRCVAAHLWPLVRRAAPTALPRPAASAEPPPPHGRLRAAPRRRERAARGLRAGAAGSNGPQPASAWGCPHAAPCARSPSYRGLVAKPPRLAFGAAATPRGASSPRAAASPPPARGLERAVAFGFSEPGSAFMKLEHSKTRRGF